MSSDKHPVEETPTERLLREALTARADQVTVHSLRPAAPPKKKLRKLKPVYAVTVPLFALAAASAGFFTIHGTPTASRQNNDPAASATATASPTGGIELPAGPSPSPSMTITPGGVPAIPQDYQPNAFKVTVDGLAKGATLTPGADPLEFRATFTNTTEVAFPKVVPGLNGSPLSTACAAADQFQVDTGAGWKDAVAAGLPMDQVQRGNAAFSLGPGESHTVRYRIRLDAAHPAGPFTIVAQVGGITDDMMNGSPVKMPKSLGEVSVDTTVGAPRPGAVSSCSAGGATSAPSSTVTTQPSKPAQPGGSASAGPSSSASASASPSATSGAAQ